MNPDNARLKAMQKAADATNGSMVSIIGLDEDKVNELCKEAGQGEVLAAVNFNCPGQIVISGEKAACERAAGLAEKYGAIKAVPLAVTGAFHTEMMASAADELAEALEKTNINNPAQIQTIANINAEYYDDAEQIKRLMTQGKIGTAVVIGGGAIGLEISEALTDLWGIETTLIEMEDQVLPTLLGKCIARAVATEVRGHGAGEVFIITE